jgi:hypothetical protein
LGLAVLHDVVDLAGGELGRNAGVVEAAALRRPGDLEVAGMVIQKERDHVARPQSERSE